MNKASDTEKELLCYSVYGFTACVLLDATYYVDPNGGSNLDALEVVCRKMEILPGWFTCVKPNRQLMVNKRYETN